MEIEIRFAENLSTLDLVPPLLPLKIERLPAEPTQGRLPPLLQRQLSHLTSIGLGDMKIWYLTGVRAQARLVFRGIGQAVDVSMQQICWDLESQSTTPAVTRSVSDAEATTRDDDCLSHVVEGGSVTLVEWSPVRAMRGRCKEIVITNPPNRG